MKQLILRIPDDLAAAIDKEAHYNLTTRSGMIRRMLVAYLRPEGLESSKSQGRGDNKNEIVTADAAGQASESIEHDALYFDQEELLKALQRQKQRAELKVILQNMKRTQARQRQAKRNAKRNSILAGQSGRCSKASAYKS